MWSGCVKGQGELWSGCGVGLKVVVVKVNCDQGVVVVRVRW